MSEDSIRTRRESPSVGRVSPRPRCQQVRMGLVSWPTVVILGASIAVATHLLGIRDGFKQSPASLTINANTGPVGSIAFRPDGAMLLAVGVDGSMAILDLAARREYSHLRETLGRVRCAAFRADSRVLATSSSTAVVSRHDLVEHRSRA